MKEWKFDRHVSEIIKITLAIALPWKQQSCTDTPEILVTLHLEKTELVAGWSQAIDRFH